MKQLDILTAQINLRTLDKAMQMSLDTIKTKHPTRVDYIEAMTLRLKELKEAEIVFYRLEEDHKKAVSMIYDLSLQVEKLKKEVTELKKLI